MKEETVDEIMERCPLKHEIRDNLWVPYCRKVSGQTPLSRYLTLYSPPMMDIKHMHEVGLVDFDGESFRGVYAVTYVEEHYAAAMKRTSGRPELLLFGDINELLTDQTTKDAKTLRRGFPFQVINLDYTNSLFGDSNRLPLSEHLHAIQSLVHQQHKSGASEFSLLITTRAERAERGTRRIKNQFARGFLDELVVRIDDNIAGNPDFTSSFQSQFEGLDGKGLRDQRYDAFVPIGLAKLVSELLGEKNYEIREMDAVYLIRDDRDHDRWLLHLAFYAKKVSRTTRRRTSAATNLRSYGRAKAFYHERRIAPFVTQVGAGLDVLAVSCDSTRLDAKHGDYVQALASQSLDLPIPEPEHRGQR